MRCRIALIQFKAIRILLVPSDPTLDNLGDLAMLRVAIQRLRTLWRDARIQVLTADPAGLRELAPDVEPLSAPAWLEWMTAFERWRAALPNSFGAALGRFLRRLRAQRPRLLRRWIDLRRRALRRDARDVGPYLDAVNSADLVVLAGMGAITDVFRGYALALLETLEVAFERGAATAMMGQGIGPLDDRYLRQRAADVLPRVDLIALREGRHGAPLLASSGVSSDRVIVTGDDTIEIAHGERPSTPGLDVGFNVRVADYSGVDAGAARRIAEVIEEFARSRSATVVSLPISQHASEQDADVIAQALNGEAPAADAGIERLFENMRRCRIVITGSYHAAVFSLSMGIPAIGLARSPYYEQKFGGLEEQFGTGCRQVKISDPAFAANLRAQMEELYAAAETFRAPLLERASAQIGEGWDAYARLKKIAESRKELRRFHLQDQDDPSWHDRAAKCVTLIDRLLSGNVPAKAVVADIGCGDQKVLRALGTRVRYVEYRPFDLLPQSPEVERFDLTRDRLPIRPDIVLLLGAGEYLDDLPAALTRLANDARYLIFSHVVRRNGGDALRQHAGWRNHLTREEVEHLLESSGWTALESVNTRDQWTAIWLCRSRKFGA